MWKRRVTAVLGGPTRTKVAVHLAGVLGLEEADLATVGATAAQLERALDISNAQVGCSPPSPRSSAPSPPCR
jgi:hypothetical protein